jgi:hypothetical protein
LKSLSTNSKLWEVCVEAGCAGAGVAGAGAGCGGGADGVCCSSLAIFIPEVNMMDNSVPVRPRGLSALKTALQKIAHVSKTEVDRRIAEERKQKQNNPAKGTI